MLTGRKFAARFKNSSAREAYLTWSAGQMFIYTTNAFWSRGSLTASAD